MKKKRYPMLFVARSKTRGRWAVYERQGPAPDQVRRVSIASTQLGAYRLMEGIHNGDIPALSKEEVHDSEA